MHCFTAIITLIFCVIGLSVGTFGHLFPTKDIVKVSEVRIVFIFIIIAVYPIDLLAEVD